MPIFFINACNLMDTTDSTTSAPDDITGQGDDADDNDADADADDDDDDDGGFDGASFFGGLILCVGIVVIVGLSYKFYQARQANYQSM